MTISLARRAFLLVVLPVTAFLAYAVLYNQGMGDYDYHPGIRLPVRTVSVR